MDSDSSTTSDSDDELPSWVAHVLPLLVEDQQQGPRSNNRSRSGQNFVNDLLNCGNPNRIRAVLRMRLDTFLALRDWLIENITLPIISICYGGGVAIHIHLDCQKQGVKP
jgi:hypothetical protein